MPVVFYLDLSQNNITEVKSQTFDGLLQLQLLNLTENGLTEIPNGAFKGNFFKTVICYFSLIPNAHSIICFDFIVQFMFVIYVY